MGSRKKRDDNGHQALKARATREKILAAVVSLINEGGYSAASSTAIAKRAKITWGAVQHHYGNKDEILLAVLELSRDVYIESLQKPSLKRGTLDERVDLYIDTVWEHYRSDLYFAFTEIVLATRGKKNKLSLKSVRLNKQLAAHMDNLVEVFDGYAADTDQLNEYLRFAHRFLAGFAIDRILDPTAPFEETHIQRIKAELTELIRSA